MLKSLKMSGSYAAKATTVPLDLSALNGAIRLRIQSVTQIDNSLNLIGDQKNTNATTKRRNGHIHNLCSSPSAGHAPRWTVKLNNRVSP